VRFREENYRPRRTLKLALTCGEETTGALNGAQWLTQNRRDLIDAVFAINEGARGELDAEGHRVALEVQAGEKTSQNYRLEVTNSGGHSSLPVKDNAIYRLAGADGTAAGCVYVIDVVVVVPEEVVEPTTSVPHEFAPRVAHA